MKYLLKNSFSYWIRTNLKDAYSGLIVQDIDFAFISEEFFFFIEEKNSHYARVGPAQKIIFKLFDDFLLLKKPKFLGTYIIYATNEESELKKKINDIKSSNEPRPNYEIERNKLEKLWDCKGKPPLKKTERERSFYRGSVIEKILDDVKKDFLFVGPIHWILLNYCSGYFIFIEEITNNAEIDNERKNFINTIDSIFANKNNNSNAKNPKSQAVYKYLGFYQLKFSQTNPDNSHEIYLNNCRVSRDELIILLNLDKDYIKYYKL